MNWHHLIGKVEVADGMASLWVKDRGYVFFAPAEEIGEYRIVGCQGVMKGLRTGGFWWDETVNQN